MANNTSLRLGTSTGFNYTPAGEKHLPASSIKGKIPCILTGPKVDRPTTVHVRPGNVRYQIQKYKDLKQTLSPPKGYDLDADDALSTRHQLTPVVKGEPIPRPPRRTGSKPVICLNTGRFFDSVLHIAKHNKLSPQLVNGHVTGKQKQAMGRRMKFATPEEIEAADKDINWKYEGELLPLVNGKRNF